MPLTLTLPTDWQDYELLDSGDGEKLERFGEYVLVRPDPQILWAKSQPVSVWHQADAVFQRTHQDKGTWRLKTDLPAQWPLHWQDLTALAKLSPFKHTGIFPEQSAHWQWMRQLLASSAGSSTQPIPNAEPYQVLNLFAYTGMASVVCAATGAKVTHVDASRSSIGWAKLNQEASGLSPTSIRWILDDVMTFVQREVKRQKRYDAIIMDPPVYGHGPTGETWDFKDSLPKLLQLCRQILTPQPLFMLINAYAVSTSAITLGNLLSQTMADHTGEVTLGELALQEANEGRLLSTGIFARWQGNAVT